MFREAEVFTLSGESVHFDRNMQEGWIVTLYVPAGQHFVLKASSVVQSIFSYSDAGINFLFGATGDKANVGFVFFMHVLPVMIFLSALMSVLYYLGIMQKFVSVIGTAIHRLLGTSKTESMAATSNIFVGTTDVYLVMKPYTKTMTKSELFALMVGGCARAYAWAEWFSIRNSALSSNLCKIPNFSQVPNA